MFLCNPSRPIVSRLRSRLVADDGSKQSVPRSHARGVRELRFRFVEGLQRARLVRQIAGLLITRRLSVRQQKIVRAVVIQVTSLMQRANRSDTVTGFQF